MSQEPVLFARSITDNISYGLPAVPFEVVVEAAQKANAHGFIMELQDGYNTGTCLRPPRPFGRASGSPTPPPTFCGPAKALWCRDYVTTLHTHNLHLAV